MEIDFLGLNSKHSSYNLMEQQNSKADAFIDSGNGGGDISLSLGSSSPLDCQIEFPDFREKKTRKFPFEKMISTCSSSDSNKLGSLAYYNRENAQARSEQPYPALVSKPLLNPSSTSGFMSNYNHSWMILRNTYQLPAQPAPLAIFCHGAAHSDVSTQKAGHNMYMAGNASFTGAGKCTRGYTPTVAMARKATLARFLEKRSHRLTQIRKSHLMNVSEASTVRGMKCNKKKMKSIM